jgi:hypothetical protein
VYRLARTNVTSPEETPALSTEIAEAYAQLGTVDIFYETTGLVTPTTALTVYATPPIYAGLPLPQWHLRHVVTYEDCPPVGLIKFSSQWTRRWRWTPGKTLAIRIAQVNANNELDALSTIVRRVMQ